MNRDDIKCLLIDWVSATFSLTLMKLLAIRLSQQAGKSLVISRLRERPQSPIFFARIESMNLNTVAVFAIASACRAEAPLRGVPPLFKMPLRPAKIIRRNRKRSARIQG